MTRFPKMFLLLEPQMCRAFLTFLVFCWAAVGLAEESPSIKYPSPDRRFGLRIGEDLKIDLIETSGRIMVDLGKLYVEPDTSYQDQPLLVWSADSKWAAYGTHGHVSGETTVYFWNGVAFEEVRLPANLPEPKIEPRKGTSGVKLKGYAVKPLRWLKPGELELSSELMGVSRDDGTKYTAKIVITVELTPPHASVKKVGKTKTEWSEKEIEKDEE
jgi:hypothetical protein